MKNEEAKYRHKYVMLIDDVELDNFINEKLIRSYNFSENVYLNTSTTSALEFLNNLVLMGKDAQHIYPEVIFVDINMPVVDGFQFIHSFQKAIDKQINKPKLVVLTSSVAEKDREITSSISKEITFLNKPLAKEMLDKL
jgi:CheY-like chemotaxis protein